MLLSARTTTWEAPLSDTMPAAASSVTWEVLQITPQLVPGPGGGYVQGKRITAKVPTGSTFYVDIPDASWSETAARDALRREATTILAVHNLTS